MNKRIRKKLQNDLFHPKHKSAKRHWQSSFNGCLNLARQFEEGNFNYDQWRKIATQIKAEWHVIAETEEELEPWTTLEPILPKQEELNRISGDLTYYSDRWCAGRFTKTALAVYRFQITYVLSGAAANP